MTRSSLTVRIGAVLIGFLVGIVLAELGLRLFWPVDNRYYLWKPNTSATFRPAPGVMPGVGPMAHIQINSNGIIGDEWSTNRADEYRILTIGGSTTECLYLDRTKQWPSLLQEGLGKTVDGRRVWVGNLGKSGRNSRDHLALMRLAIDQYDVDAIVILVGGNDMVHRLMQGEAYDPHFVEDDVRYRDWLSRRFAIVPTEITTSRKLFFKRTALWRLAQRLKYLYKSSPPQIVEDNAGDWLVRVRKRRQAASLVDELPPLDTGLDEYGRNVTEIIQEARQRSIRIVLLTQPTIWKTTMSEKERDLLWMGWRPDGSFYTTESLASAMDSYNHRLIDICAKLNVECIDLASNLPRTLDVFYDDMHLNEGGARSVAQQLVDYFRMLPPFAAASH